MCRALVKEPKILLLDEPMSNLDARLKIEIREVIKKIQKELKVTSIIVTHDQEEAMAIADKIAILDNGNIQQYDTPEMLYQYPANLFVANFMGNPPMNFISAVIEKTGDTCVYRMGELKVPVSDVMMGKILPHVGKKVRLGVRSHQMSVCDGRQEGSLPVKVQMVENLGKELLVTGDVHQDHIRVTIDDPGRFGEMKRLEQADRVLIGGHRGCSCEYPENSIAAMAEGLRQGADYLEIDIQLTKDHVPVVYHDVRLETKTDISGYVHEFDLQVLKEHVPGLCTLQEAMEWGCLCDAYFALEIKSVPLDMQAVNKELIDRMLPVIKTTGMIGQVFLFGADYQVLRYAKEKNPKIQIGLIVPFVPADPVELMRSVDAFVYLSYVYNMTPKIIEDLKHNGYYVSGAILREERWVRRAGELEVAMFESDDPGQAKELLSAAPKGE